MTHVVICSAVRNGMAYLPAYRSQIEQLKREGGLTLQVCILEGDSTDGSRAFLEAWQRERPDQLILGHQAVGLTANLDDRAARWAAVGNACLDLIPADSPHTHVLWLEADLCFPPELLTRLLSHRVDIVAPIVWLGGCFYDTWGFRELDGTRWTAKPGHFPHFVTQTLYELGSVGSCVLFRREIFDRGVRFRGPYETGLLVGVCHDARALGFRVFADLSTAILHPADPWEAQMWRCAELDVRGPDGRPVPISPLEAERLGLDRYLPVFEAAKLQASSVPFWHVLHRLLGSARLEVEAEGWVDGAKNHYALAVRALPDPHFFPQDVPGFRQVVRCTLRTAPGLEGARHA